MSGKAASRVGKSIDWDYLSKVVVSESGKRELLMLRRAYEEVSATIAEKFSIKPTRINWDFYKQKLGPSIVNIFEQSYASLDKEVPDYEDEFTPEYQNKYQALLMKATQQEEESKKKVLMLEKEIERIREEKQALRTMTVDEYFAKHPDIKEKIDDEIRNQNWGY